MRGWLCLVFFQYEVGGFRIFRQEKFFEEFLVSGNYGNLVKHLQMFLVLVFVAYEQKHNPGGFVIQ